MLELKKVTVGYVAEAVLDGIDLAFEPGKVSAVLGPNGAGKTTMLKAIVGLIRVRSGDITLNGESIVGKQTEALAKEGVLLSPEGRKLFGSLTVMENLRAGQFTGRDAPSIDDVLDLFPRLKERLTSKARSLSGGEQQMLAVSRALVGGPTVLMLDEPSLGLAPKLVHQLFDIFRTLAAGGRTVVLSEQNVSEATRIAEYCHLISDRRIAFSGPSGTVEERRAVQARYSQLLALDSGPEQGGRDAA
jgi:branched-chain amino acid transport system ATP-binding protein